MQYMRRTPLAIMALAATVACSTNDDAATDSLAADTAALNRDISLAGTDTGAQPALTDVPAGGSGTTAAPATSRPTTSGTSGTTTRRPSTSGTTSRPSSTSGTSASSGSSASGTSGSSATVGSGFTFNAKSNTRVCTNTHKVGDTFTATVSDVVESAGSASIPSGATVTMRITEAKRAENVNGEPSLRADVVSISWGGRTYTPQATVTYVNVDKVRSSTRKDDAKKVIGGAVIGAVAGQVLGKDTRGTVTGAAAGAAAGTAAAAATANFDGCLGETGRVQVRLDQSLNVRS